MTKFSAVILPTLLGLTFIPIAPSPANAAVSCDDHRHTGSARAPTKSLAQKGARQKWRFEVLKHRHPDKILWGVSRDRNMACSSKWYGYKCWARAVPCSAFKPVTAPNEHDHRGGKSAKDNVSPADRKALPPMRKKPSNSVIRDQQTGLPLTEIDMKNLRVLLKNGNYVVRQANGSVNIVGMNGRVVRSFPHGKVVSGKGIGNITNISIIIDQNQVQVGELQVLRHIKPKATAERR